MVARFGTIPPGSGSSASPSRSGGLAATGGVGSSDWKVVNGLLVDDGTGDPIDGGDTLEATDNRCLMPGQVGLWSNESRIEVRSFMISPL